MGELLVAFCAGLGLASACGFRVFLPLLALGLGVRLGWVAPGNGFAFVGDTPALIALAVATLIEIAAFYIPWVDHALDVIATPLATGAGLLAMGAVLPGDTPEYLRWSLAVVGGSAPAATVQLGTAAARGLSTVTTGGFGNWVISTLESVAATVLAVLAVIVPILAGVVVLAVLIVTVRLIRRWRRARAAREIPLATG